MGKTETEADPVVIDQDEVPSASKIPKLLNKMHTDHSNPQYNKIDLRI